MIQELPVRSSLLTPFKFKRYFESKNRKIRIFGQCEVTGKVYEIHIPVDGFFLYVQGFRPIKEALSTSSQEERDFILTGVSPEGQKLRSQGINTM